MILGTHHHWHLLYSSWLWSPYWSSNGDFLLITIVFILFLIVIIVLLVCWSWFLMFNIITFFITFFFILPGHDCFVGLLIVVFGIHYFHHFLFFFCCHCLVGFLVMIIGAKWEIKWFVINLVIGFLNYNDHLQLFAFIIFTILFFFIVMIVSLVSWSGFLLHYKK